MPTNISTDYCVELLTNGCENITPAFGPVFADWPDSGKRVGRGRSDDRLGSRAKPFTSARPGAFIGAVLAYVIPAVPAEATNIYLGVMPVIGALLLAQSEMRFNFTILYTSRHQASASLRNCCL